VSESDGRKTKNPKGTSEAEFTWSEG
jgi:hypothetical protein